MDSATERVLNETGAHTPNLLALLIVEMRKANQLAQEQQEILKGLLYEVNQTRMLVHTWGSAVRML
jgi:hypothetical protein